MRGTRGTLGCDDPARQAALQVPLFRWTRATVELIFRHGFALRGRDSFADEPVGRARSGPVCDHRVGDIGRDRVSSRGLGVIAAWSKLRCAKREPEGIERRKSALSPVENRGFCFLQIAMIGKSDPFDSWRVRPLASRSPVLRQRASTRTDRDCVFCGIRLEPVEAASPSCA